MALIIGEKNPKLVQSEDIGNWARQYYGKPVAETAIGEKEDGLSEEELKAQQEKEDEEKALAERNAKLEGINNLPEEERVSALLEAGFEEEAAELSAKLSEKKQEDEEKRSEDSANDDDVDGGNPETPNSTVEEENTETPAPKRTGRPKKS